MSAIDKRVPLGYSVSMVTVIDHPESAIVVPDSVRAAAERSVVDVPPQLEMEKAFVR